MAQAAVRVGEASVSRQARPAHGSAERSKLPVGRDGDADPCVLASAAVDAVGRHRVVPVAPPAGRLPREDVGQGGVAAESDDGLHGREVDGLPGTRVPPVVQGGEDRVGQSCADPQVDGVADLHRRAVLVAGDVAQAAAGAEHAGVAGIAPQRAAGAEGRAGGEDDGGIGPAQLFVAQSKALQHSRAEILNEHVADPGQRLDQRNRRGLFQVQPKSQLVQADAVEGWRTLQVAVERVVAAPHGVQGRDALDLDHLGAQQGQVQRAIGPGQRPGQVEDADAFQGPPGGCHRCAGVGCRVLGVHSTPERPRSASSRGDSPNRPQKSSSLCSPRSGAALR